ncbi:DUF2868 domain-containing protein [Massilia cavernae]|uniref:DUF2868 domain-containing protein n=1 Tax=Massilia cavernae TaxID=2320864 RepID=A0A418XF58_9BURK|nr:DUF2868 domain-containing protein [Massilia cavernae]RJG11164.1 DUF2868 domain-containing protein [Massilia cavernae]
MNEQVARDVVLVRAIETMDIKSEILSPDDRMYASRSAKELAQWQASDSRTAVTSEHFLQQRSELILKRLSERIPAFAAFAQRRPGLKGFSIALPVAGLILGAGLDRISDPHRVDLLSAPLLAIIGWNLLVYVILLAWLFVPSRDTGWASKKLLRRASAGKSAIKRKLPQVLSVALLSFMSEWASLRDRLTRARLARTFHLAAAMFGVGAMLSLYARGFLSQYIAGWESTFLNGAQVHAILSVLFAPAAALFSIQPFSLAEIEALRFTQPQAPAAGARWVHLYAATLFLAVVLPRLAMALYAHWRARGLSRNFPIDLDQPYFRKLGGQAGTTAPGVLRVLPYSFTLDEARDRGLATLAHMLLGEQARVMLRPSSAYGEDAAQLPQGAGEDEATLTAVLFNLAATPEKENHGAFLEQVKRASPRGVAVLVDESAFLERMGGAEARLAERIALWQQFCNYHHAPATIVNLLHPERRPVDGGAGPAVSKAP